MGRFETVTPIYENTIQKAYYNDENVLRYYDIAPVEGYVIHDKEYDAPVFDESIMDYTDEVIPGYTGGSISVGYNYDFEANPREIYAVLRGTVPENQIFGGDNNDHEVM